MELPELEVDPPAAEAGARAAQSQDEAKLDQTQKHG